MQLVTFAWYCLLLTSGGAYGGIFSSKKEKVSDPAPTNNVAPVESTNTVGDKPAIQLGETTSADYENNLLIQANQLNNRPIKGSVLSKDTKKVGKKNLLPQDSSDHPVQVVSGSDSVPLPHGDPDQDLHIVPQKKKTKKTEAAGAAEGDGTDNTVAVITEEKLDAAVDKMKKKQDKSVYKNPEIQDLILRAKDVKKERAYLKKLVLAYSATQAFLSATDVIPFRDPVIFTVIKVVTYLKNVLQKPLSERYAEHQRVYSELITEMMKNDPKYSHLITKMPKKLVIKTKDGRDIVVDIIDEKVALKEDNLNLEKMNFVSLFRTGMQMK